MDRATALTMLREHAEELRSDGVVRLRLFGSTARDQATEASDIDLLADFSPDKKLTLRTLSALQLKLGKMLAVKVDLSSEPWLHDHVRESALKEAVVVF